MALLKDLLCGCTPPARASAEVLDGNLPPRAPIMEPNQLSPRGPQLASSAVGNSVPACFYEADPTDAIDSQLSIHLSCLDRHTTVNLLLQRLRPGDYMFDGRRVRLYWGPCSGLSGTSEVLVREDDSNMMATPLAAYLRQVLDVKASLNGHNVGAPAVTRVPQDMRLTFMDSEHNSVDVTDPGNMERVRSMQVACEQARLREQAAEAYELAQLIPYASRGTRHVLPSPGPATVPALGVPGNAVGVTRSSFSPQGMRGRHVTKSGHQNITGVAVAGAAVPCGALPATAVPLQGLPRRTR